MIEEECRAKQLGTMKRIYKYYLVTDDLVRISMSQGAKVLSCAFQGQELCLWALVDPHAQHVIREFAVRGTGHDASGLEESEFVGTVFLGPLVFHVFDEGER